MKWLRFASPLAAFVVMGYFLAAGLGKDTRKVPSPLIGKPAPAYDLPELHAPGAKFSGASMKGRPYVINVWGSWCFACREEHPTLTEFARTEVVPVVGLNWKDQPQDATRWLQQFGDPYDHVPVDAEGRVAIDFGVYGAPETFVVDGDGVIRYKYIGPLTPEVVRDELMPAVEAANKAASPATGGAP